MEISPKPFEETNKFYFMDWKLSPIKNELNINNPGKIKASLLYKQYEDQWHKRKDMAVAWIGHLKDSKFKQQLKSILI